MTLDPPAFGYGTMSAQQRYRTLAHYISRVYSAEDGLRTDTMKTGLDEITAVLNPLDGRGWATVKGDSGRLLKVWEAKENNPAAAVVAAQITDLLGELSMEAPGSVAAPAPVLVVQDHIQHVHPFGYHRTPITTRPVPTDEVSSIASSESESVVSSDSESVASSVKQVTIMAAHAVAVDAEDIEATDDEATVNRLDEQSVAASAAEDEESEKASIASGPEAEAEAEAEEDDHASGSEEEMPVSPNPDAEDDEEAKQVKIDGKMYWLEKASQILYEVADGDEVGDEVGKMVDGAPVFNISEEEDIVEPADDDEEEEESGMNVEQVMIRGRAYWLEVDTKKLYAVVGDDDLGDEIGEMVNGKPRFYAK